MYHLKYSTGIFNQHRKSMQSLISLKFYDCMFETSQLLRTKREIGTFCKSIPQFFTKDIADI